MFVSRVIQGRLLSSDDVELIRRLIADHPHWSRNRLSIAVSEQFNWRTANGQLKDMSARLLLAKLAESGLIQLPPRQRRGGRQRLRVLSEPDLFWLASGSVQPIESPLKALRPLEVVLVEARTKEANDFICHLHHHHYLGFGGASGQNLRCSVSSSKSKPSALPSWKKRSKGTSVPPTARLLLSESSRKNAPWHPSGRGANADIRAPAGTNPIMSMSTLRSNSVPVHTAVVASSRIPIRSSSSLKTFRPALDRLAAKVKPQYDAIAAELRQ